MTKGVYKRSLKQIEHLRSIAGNRKGKKKSSEEIAKISLSKMGSKNPQWKGDAVTYKSLHQWVRSNLPKPELCPHCLITPPHDVANKSGKYLRDLTDWEWLCRKCHMISDGRITRIGRKIK